MKHKDKIVLGTFLIYFLKVLATSCSVTDVCVLAALLLGSLFFDVQVERQTIKKMKEDQDKINEEMKDIRSYVSGLKLQTNLRNQQQLFGPKS